MEWLAFYTPGMKGLTELNDILRRWKEYCTNLYTQDNNNNNNNNRNNNRNNNINLSSSTDSEDDSSIELEEDEPTPQILEDEVRSALRR